jgi:hypothetical protein
MRSSIKAPSTLLSALLLLTLLSGCASPSRPGTIRLHYLIAEGELDVEDKYSSVVQVIIPNKGSCSGVAVSQHLVLTAAHCLCLPPPEMLRSNTTYSAARSTAQNTVVLKCSETVQIIATLYASTPEKPKALPYEGPVRIQVHEAYTFQTDDDGEVVRSEMDLAAIHLGGVLEGVKVDGHIPAREVQATEFLVAVGYGPTGKKMGGSRYFGSAKILKLETSSSKDRVFAFGSAGVPFREVYALKGDSGGPCFRERPDGSRWLIGILSHGAELDGAPITFFTSTFHHREWISRQEFLSHQYAESL